MSACDRVATFFRDGRGVPKDATSAASVFEQACDNGYAKSCTSAAALYAGGAGVAKDKAKELALLEKAKRVSVAIGP
jgi:hypothetical protein